MKIGDFGLARPVAAEIMSNVGTPSYKAPEMIQGKPYGKAADVWSLGCIFLEVQTPGDI